MSDVIILGAGGHAKVVAATVQAAGGTVDALFDDDPARHGTRVLGAIVRGRIQEAPAGRLALIGIGDNATRARLATSTQRWTTAVHPSAVIHDTVRVGVGSVVFARAVLQPDARVGGHVIINTGALLDHDVRVGDHAHICPGAVLAGGVTIEEGVFLGAGAVVCPNVRIGAWSVVGAGAVVTRDIPAWSRAVGVPARATPLAKKEDH